MSLDVLNRTWPEWQIEEKPLGRGSFGTVYKAVRTDHNVESHAAIKVISIPADPSEVDSLRSEGMDENAIKAYLQEVVNDFVREIQLMESLKGIQNIVSVEDYKVVEKPNEIGWNIFIRMELLTSFNTFIYNKHLSEAEVIKLGCDICTALEICAKKNIIHRDIKPENIFVNQFGHYKLGDFGIARKMENMTGALSQKGTFNYMAPEVATGTEYDARVDTYSLGIVLYRLLNKNRLPFLATDAQVTNPNERRIAVDRRIRGEAFPPPCEASPAMADVILRACAHDPKKRFASANEMKRALAAVGNGTYKIPASAPVTVPNQANYDATIPLRGTSNNIATAPASTPEKAPAKKKKKGKLILLLVILALVAAAAITTVVIVNSYQEKQEKISSIMDEAMSFAALEDYESAIDVIEAGLKEYPDSEKLQNGLENHKSSLAEQIAAIIEEAEIYVGTADYLNAIAVIKRGQETHPDSPELSAKIEEYYALITADIDSIAAQADALHSQADHSGAIAKINEGLNRYPEEELLTQKLSLYTEALKTQVKDQTLAEAALLAAKEKYTEAMALLKEAMKSGDSTDEYQAAYDAYNQSYLDSVKTEALDAAKAAAKKKNYLGAYNTLKQALSVVTGDKELTDKAAEYENAYVEEISSQVEALLAENNFTEAQKLLTISGKEFPANETLKTLATKVGSYKYIPLDSLTPINGGFTWNDGTPADPFESDYSGIRNYTIYHGRYCESEYTTSVEYKIDQKYNLLQLDISPYAHYGKNASSCVQIYVDNVLRYVSPAIVQKSGITSVQVDVTNATYLKIVIQKGKSGCIMLSDVVLATIPNYESQYSAGTTSVATLNPINGGFTWDSGIPTNIKGDSYETASNYVIYHGRYCESAYDTYAEYYLAGKYTTLSLDMAPYSHFGEDATSVVKIYVDDTLVYTGTISQKSERTSTGDLDITNATYIKIVIEKGKYGCVILSNILLKNAE